jgi:hypothetical protein
LHNEWNNFAGEGYIATATSTSPAAPWEECTEILSFNNYLSISFKENAAHTVNKQW